MTVEVSAPKSRYLKPASVDLASASMKPERTYRGMEVVSIARYSMTRSPEAAIRFMPMSEARSRR
jgi:hypothetical protein